ncbi:outer envelope pore protein 16-2, chloroplastic [Senna tora]|uniref:Outer envelope pore protein 16-2, chloroplastic n=1 Tax=Senna tora TaxID=362788 RepID=A0A835CCR4_9FABA|nr:outer envelope pore protein 16-2, chloroplastic [Senna tora]
MSSSNLDSRALLEELRSLDEKEATLFDFGHPLLNRITHTFLKAAGVKNTGKESFQWGLAAGIYSGLTYGLKEARGVHDWKSSAVAGAMTGATLALTLEEASHHHIVQSAITGAAISTAANLLNGIF